MKSPTSNGSDETAPRRIRTDYSFRGELVKVTRAVHPNRANVNAFRHMQINEYGAGIAEVWDENTGELHAQFRLSAAGELRTTFTRDPSQFITVGAVNGAKKAGLIK